MITEQQDGTSNVYIFPDMIWYEFEDHLNFVIWTLHLHQQKFSFVTVLVL